VLISKSSSAILQFCRYVEEIGFAEEDSFEPSSPQSSVYEDMDDDNLSVKSSRKSRGKGIKWIDYCNESNDGVLVEYMNMEAVQADATRMDYSKMGSSIADVLMFNCKTKNCQFRRKYGKLGSCSTYMSYYDGEHDHSKQLIDQSDHRGLTGDQKVLVKEAFQLERKSAGDIIGYFRLKRSKLTETSEIDHFPLDPEIGKLNNYIQAYKKRNGSQYDSTSNHLKIWCDSHSPSTVNINDVIMFNTPFVLGYMLVSKMLISTSYNYVCIPNFCRLPFIC
jgi:hypothetical protein